MIAPAMSNIGVSGRNSVPTPTIKPVPKAEYSTLFRGGRCALFKRKSGFGTLLMAITRAQQARAVQNIAKTSVSGTAAYFEGKGHRAASQSATECTPLSGAESSLGQAKSAANLAITRQERRSTPICASITQ